MRTTPRTLLTTLAGVSIALAGVVQTSVLTPTAQASSPEPRTLSGTVPTAVTTGQAKLLGRRPASATISFTVALTPPDPSGLAQFVQSVNDPTSPDYHQFLSQDEANQRFNPTAAQQDEVMTWLAANGLTVTGTYPNHLLVDASGTVGQVESLFHLSLNSYAASVNGAEREFTSPNREPTLDAAVAGDVTAVVGLDTFPRFQILTNGSTHGAPAYYPQDFANAYDVNPLWDAGYTGTGQHIGITLWTVPPSTTTLQAFGTHTGAAVATTANGKLKVIPVDGGTTSSASPDQGEAGMDIEYTSGMAPGATIDYYEAPTDSSGNASGQGLIDALNLAGTDSNDNRQISNSWGECEPSSAADGFVSAAEKVFAANEATGHSYFFATGDTGSWCDASGNGVGVDPYAQYPASSPNVTAVGGTRFSGPIGGAWPGEASWAYSATGNNGNPEGSSGGYSAIFARPSWQTGAGLAANGKRGFPDISADADPGTGAYVCYGSGSACAQFGGTSLASPLWAGMTAVLNQYLAAQGKPAAGFLAPDIYRLSGSTQTYPALHDVTGGTNGVYKAGTGWDAVTGLGSTDLYNLARDLAGTSDGSTSPTPSPTPTSPSAGGLIANGGFESGSTSWQVSSTNGAQIASSTRSHTGSDSGWFCGINACNERLWQTFTVPSGISSATLVYWTFADTSETVPCADTLTTQLKTAAGALISTPGRICSGNSTGWLEHTVNLATLLKSRPGQTLQISFQGITNSTKPTDFFVDDVSLVVNAGTSSTPTPSPTATPTPSPTSSPTPSPTVSPTNSPTTTPPSSGGLIANGDFESGSTSWQVTSTNGAQMASSTRAHSGSDSAWFCGINACNERASQNFTVPVGISSATLVYWTFADTSETVACADTLTTQLRTTAGALVSTPGRICSSNSIGWLQHTVNLTTPLKARAGQTLQLSFLGVTNSAKPTDFYLDDVNLTVTTGATSTPSPTTTPTPTITPPSGGSGGSCPGSQSGCMQAMLTMLNNDRAQAGVAPLTLNLTESNGSGSCVGAYGHSVHMSQIGSISHDQFPADICIAYTTAGENVGEAGYGNMLTDLQQLDSLMMGEPHGGTTCATTVNHACNILNPAFHQVGIGIYGDSSGRTWLTEDFTN